MQTALAVSPQEAFLRRLFHRWFIQYNPFYLLSAVLVLYGVYRISGAYADERSIAGHLVVFGVTELYAVALILGCALLTRIGLRRPAVFVALLAAFYQGDVALGTQSFALFGSVGELASLAWIVLFVGKLHLLGWALQLKLSRSAVAVPTLGAVGLAAIPHLARRVDAQALTPIVGLWVFSLFALAAWTSREVTSKAALDDWGRTVLRRALLATWTIWACITIGYLAFWTSNYHLDRAMFVPLALLVSTRFLRRELAVLLAVSGTLVLVGVSSPQLLRLAAAASAVVFALHALRKPVLLSPEEESAPEVYRGAPADLPDAVAVFAMAPPAALARQLAWSGYCLYLSAWTFSWSGGAWPLHLLALDAAVGLSAALVVWRLRHRVIALPMVASAFHWSIQVELVRAPQSNLQWGFATVGLGFALLLGSLLGSWRFQRRLQTAEMPGSGSPLA